MTAGPAAATAAGDPEVSVVVPSFNAARTINACLDALLAQQTAARYEIIVVDSSTDDTAARIAACAPRVMLVRSEQRLPPGPARNLGIARARAPILAFTDTDCVVAPDWIEAIRSAHREHDAAGGRIFNGTPESLCGTALYFTEFVEFGGGPARRVASMPSCNISYKRTLLDRYGPFPDVAWGEEYILNHRLPEGVWFSPAIRVRHLNRTGCNEALRHARKVGHGCALSRRATGQTRLLFRLRPLALLLWPYRLAKIAACAMRTGQLTSLLFSAPVLVVQLAAWTLGFLRGTSPNGSQP